MDKLKPEAIRAQLDIDQDEFSKLIGISKSTYCSRISKNSKVKRKWYIDELIALKELGHLESVEQIDLD